VKTVPKIGLVRNPPLSAILLGCIPVLAMCLSVPLWDRVYPMFLGIPFNLFWLTLWILLTPVCMLGAYRRDRHAGLLAARSLKDDAR
jgi:hypothetical protein